MKQDIEYSHALNQGLITVLTKLYNVDEAINLNKLGLSFSERANTQKLQYWGLIKKLGNGVWIITNLGKAFVEGRTSIRRVVVTLRGCQIDFKGEEVWFHDYHSTDYKQQRDYTEDTKRDNIKRAVAELRETANQSNAVAV